MLTKALLADASFMFFKYLLETGALCFLLGLCIYRSKTSATKSLCRSFWLIFLSSAVQIFCHYLCNWYFPQITFMHRYLVFNALTLHIIYFRELRSRPFRLFTYLSVLMVADAFCQISATFLIFYWKKAIIVVTQFQIVEQLISTAIIWLLFALCYWLIYSFSQGIRYIPPKEALLFCSYCWLLFLISKLLGNYFISSQNYPWVTAVIYMLFLVALCLFFVIAMLMLRERDKATQQASLIQQYSLQLQHADELNYVYQDLHAMRHEIKNQFLYMEHLLDKGDYEQLREYFLTQNSIIEAKSVAIDCGNTLVNAILWAKQQAADRLNIPITFEAALPAELPIKGTHLCSMLANLLDNAIEGSIGVQTPRIQVIIQMRQNYLFCCVSNRIDADILQINPELRSTKKDHFSHGYGIRNIRSVAEQYNGMCQFIVENGEFVATVMLLCNSTQES